MRKGDWQEAIVQYRRVVESIPDDANQWLLLGNAYRQAGRTEDAITSYQRVLSLLPDNAAAKAALVELSR